MFHQEASVDTIKLIVKLLNNLDGLVKKNYLDNGN